MATPRSENPVRLDPWQEIVDCHFGVPPDYQYTYFTVEASYFYDNQMWLRENRSDPCSEPYVDLEGDFWPVIYVSSTLCLGVRDEPGNTYPSDVRSYSLYDTANRIWTTGELPVGESVSVSGIPTPRLTIPAPDEYIIGSNFSGVSLRWPQIVGADMSVPVPSEDGAFFKGSTSCPVKLRYSTYNSGSYVCFGGEKCYAVRNNPTLFAAGSIDCSGVSITIAGITYNCVGLYRYDISFTPSEDSGRAAIGFLCRRS